MRNHILGHISGSNEQNVAKVKHKIAWIKAFQQVKWVI